MRERTMHPLEQLEFSCQVVKRAQYEAFQLSLTNQGVVIRNGSHANPEITNMPSGLTKASQLTVSVRQIKRTTERANTGVAVATRRPVLYVAREQGGRVFTDGGFVDTAGDSVQEDEEVVEV